jgi:hypothetical protein
MPHPILLVPWLLAVLPGCASLSTPIGALRARLFGQEPVKSALIDAPDDGVVFLATGRPEQFSIGPSAPERAFPGGQSRYRVVELPRELDHATVRVRVIAAPNDHGRGHTVFKPTLYVLDDDDDVRDTREVKPLHLDIRPFRATRLLACVTLDKVRRFAVATTPAAVGKSYESEVREAIKAPSSGGFYYATDAVKVKLPFAATGRLVLEVEEESHEGSGC